jgi:hypothetical protein
MPSLRAVVIGYPASFPNPRNRAPRCRVQGKDLLECVGDLEHECIRTVRAGDLNAERHARRSTPQGMQATAGRAVVSAQESASQRM